MPRAASCTSTCETTRSAARARPTSRASWRSREAYAHWVRGSAGVPLPLGRASITRFLTHSVDGGGGARRREVERARRIRRPRPRCGTRAKQGHDCAAAVGEWSRRGVTQNDRYMALCVCMCACASVYDCVGRGLDLFGSPPPWLTPGAGLLVALLVQLWHRVLRSRVCCCCRRCTHEI